MISSSFFIQMILLYYRTILRLFQVYLKNMRKKDKIVLTVRAVLMLSYYKKRREKTNIKEVSYE